MQPPSGGCVLKPQIVESDYIIKQAAAFGRLCVETLFCKKPPTPNVAAAFGRLCVETAISENILASGKQPPSGGCVLKQIIRS